MYTRFTVVQMMKAIVIFMILFSTNNVWADSDLHQSFNSVLQESVVDGKVDYLAIKNNPNFSSYIDSLSSKPLFENKNQELAYWINAYNALVIQGILNGGSPSTFFGRKRFFEKDTYQLAGMEISLNDLERKIIIPLGEPRTHFAINCASSSCPKLLSEVFSAEQLDQQLTTAAKDFINDPSRNQFDRDNKIAKISKIFDWFEEDFVKHSGSVENYIAQYINDETIAKDLIAGNFKIKYLKYDWNLNGTMP